MITTQKSNAILFLGDSQSPLLHWLAEQESNLIQTSDKITADFIKTNNIQCIISYGYRHIIKRDVLDILPSNVFNLHISLLPWNRGADPNFWSFIDNTPKGVTIHHIDEGVDTGDIIAQQEVTFTSAKETLTSSYQLLQQTIEALFKLHWPSLKKGVGQRKAQVGKGTSHRVGDKAALAHLLTEGWNTPVTVLERHAKKAQKK
ncbi:MAG: formyltransferase family protein [Colwellia sp.]|nr:formyltransferase family protein [Colwellia sp.]